MQKVKERHCKEKAADYYLNSEEAIKEKSKKLYKNLKKKKKTKLKSIKEKDISNWYSVQKRSITK